MISLSIDKKLPNLIYYNICYENEVVGFAQLRLIPTKSEGMPDGFENHIYYEIKEEYRKKGYATKALGLLLKESNYHGLKLIVLNISDSNIASQKVAEANGAKIVTKELDKNGELFRKYIIKASD